LIAVTHCPTIFWVSQATDALTSPPRLDIAWRAAVSVIEIYRTLRRVNEFTPVALPSFFIPLSIARGVLMLAKANKTAILADLAITLDEFEELHASYLDESFRLLMDLTSYWANMSQIKISAQPVALYVARTDDSEKMPKSATSISYSLPGTPFDGYFQTATPLYRFAKDTMHYQQVSLFESEAWQAPPTFFKEIQYHEEQSWETSRKPLVWDWSAEGLPEPDDLGDGGQLTLTYPLSEFSENQQLHDFVV